MPKTSIEIREPRLEEKERLQDFYRKIYRPDYPFLDDRFLLWWFNQNPLFERKDNFSCKIALDGDAIIGHFGFLPVAVWAEGGGYSGAWTGNFVVDQAYRGQGIGRKLARAIMSEFDVTLDIGANELAEKVLSRLGWRNFGGLHRYVGVLDQVQAKFLTDNPKYLDGGYIAIQSEINPPGVACEIINEFSQATDEFWDEFKKRIPYATERTHTFLNWRYRDHPLFNYKIFQATSAGRVAGFAVLRFEEARGIPEKVKVTRIVEFLAFPEAAAHLLRHIVNFSRENSAALVDFFCSSDMCAEPFRAFGFLSSPASHNIARLFQPVVLGSRAISFNGANCGKKLNQESFSDQARWYVTTGDGDQDRPNSINS